MTKIRVLHLSSDNNGGASKAASRLNSALTSRDDIESTLFTLIEYQKTKSYFRNFYFLRILKIKLSFHFDRFIAKLVKTKFTDIPRSFSMLGAINARMINALPCDIIHLHWINNGLISISEIGKITKPVIWTFHDMWPICGSQHLELNYPHSNKDYFFANYINELIVQNKKKCWSNIKYISTPSSWLSRISRQSSIFNGASISTIPNTLNTEIFKPLDKNLSRDVFNLPINKKLILFGAIGGAKNPLKGWDYLIQALTHLKNKQHSFELVIFGSKNLQYNSKLPFKTHFMGHLCDDYTLALLYNACDVHIVPSKIESFCQTASESISCGTPVVAFNHTGLKDVIIHKSTGYLAVPFDISDFCYGIEFIIKNETNLNFNENCKNHAQASWSYPVVSESFSLLYKKINNK